MLSRVASNLYWMGRYLERSENMARYIKELYFSSIDAPIGEMDRRKFVLESILYMTGTFDQEEPDEEKVLYKVGFDRENSGSLISIVTSARENARGARSEISTDIWERINSYYHFIQNYPLETYLTTGLYDVTQRILDQASVIRGKVYGSILHDEIWAVISCAMFLERSLQTIRILNSKLHDIYKIKTMGFPVNKLSFEWATLLRCTESFDMNRKYYRSIPNREQVLEFVLINIHNPRSLHYSIRGINNYLMRISQSSTLIPNSVEFKIQKLLAHYQFLTIDDFKENEYELINYTYDVLQEVASEIESKYLSY